MHCWLHKTNGGVDLSDQINSYNSCLQKTTKWYCKLFFHLFNVCLINAYLLYKKFHTGEKKLDHHQFLISIVKSLLYGAPIETLSKGRKHVSEKPSRLTGRHFVSKIPSTPGAKRKNPTRDCVACNITKAKRDGFKRKQTSYMCTECEKPLCIPDCFRVYHTHKHYKQVLLPDAGVNYHESDDQSNSD